MAKCKLLRAIGVVTRLSRCVIASVGVVLAGLPTTAHAATPQPLVQSVSAGLTQGVRLNAISCITNTTDCVASAKTGSLVYAENVSTTSEATWHMWAGPETTSSQAVECISTTLCLLAENGILYYATSLGGSWTRAYSPVFGVDSIACASVSLCVAGQNGYGYFRYAISPASPSWNLEKQSNIESDAMRSVFCLSESFCAMVDSFGSVYVASTISQIESSSWTATTVAPLTTLNGVACTSKSSCVIVDGAGDVFNLAINSSGEATALEEDIDGSNHLMAVTCAGSACVTVDNKGNIIVSQNGGSWKNLHTVSGELTDVSCASSTLCVAVATTGEVVTFDPGSANMVAQVASVPRLDGISCILGTTDCVVSAENGNLIFAEDSSPTSAAIWHRWTGPGPSPSEAVHCVSASLCLLADGLDNGYGGYLYYSTSLGGAWDGAYSPVYGVDSVSCASAALCVAGQNAYAYFHYATSPASPSWNLEEQGNAETAAIKSVFCLSESFCAMATASGKVYVATSTSQIESSAWKATDVDESTSIDGITCTSRSSCVIIDAKGYAKVLSINASGEATVKGEAHDPSGGELTGLTCISTEKCISVDSRGYIYELNSEETEWFELYNVGGDFTGVSCASSVLCMATESEDKVVSFLPEITYEGFSAYHQPPGAWRPYASNSVWNSPVPANPAPVAESAAMVEYLLKKETEGERSPPETLVAGQSEVEPPNSTTGVKEGDYAHPVYWAAKGDPIYELKGVEERPGQTDELSGLKIAVPLGAMPADGQDGHMAVVEPNGEEYDMWRAKPPRREGGRGVLEFSWGSRIHVNGSGLGGQATAAWFGLMAGIIRPQEFEAGEIDHALFVVAHVVRGMVFPASAHGTECAASLSEAEAKKESLCNGVPVPIGAHLWLNMSESEIAEIKAPWQRTLARALHRYGGYVGDTGGGSGFGFELESPESRLAFGLTDPMLEFAEKEFCGHLDCEKEKFVTHNAINEWTGEWAEPAEAGWTGVDYVLQVDNNIPWASKLEVIEPPAECLHEEGCAPE